MIYNYDFGKRKCTNKQVSKARTKTQTRNGWTDVATLIGRVEETNNITLDFEILKHIVDSNMKQRFVFNETFDKIRANQGHSVHVELGYEAKRPPAILYHGTGSRSAPQILETGLQKRHRHHVHLSSDVETAMKVASDMASLLYLKY